jgi:glycosyltransferase involved in cell wall biosynthesis
MRVSIVTPDLSHNCLGRSYVLAQLLEKNHEVEIIGPQFDAEVWGPLRNAYRYKGVKTSKRVYRFATSIPELLTKITGDVIYASKPRMNSYGLSLLKALRSDYPLVLDIDDWESGFAYHGSQLGAYLKGIPFLAHANSFYYTRLFESLTNLADARTVSNRFLQEKFSGTIVPHARDTDSFDPKRFDKQNIRKELDLPANKFIVMFSGTPHPYKGVGDLARALSRIECVEIKGIVVGADDSNYVRKVKHIAGDSITIRGRQPFDEIPKWIAAADMIAIPQRNTPATRGQLPAKVFDAMAMAKPIVATNVSDLPIILEECGLIVEPEAPEQLRDAILEVFSDKILQEELGQSARQKCIQNYSYEALAPVLDDIVLDVVSKHHISNK